MRFHIQKASFLAALRLAQSVASKNTTVPVLAAVYMRTTEQQELELFATDLTVVTRTVLPCQVDRSGALCVTAKSMHDFVANLPGEQVAVCLPEKGAKVEIRSGRTAYNALSLDPIVYPSVNVMLGMEESTWVEVSNRDLLDLVEGVFATVATDESRMMLCGGFLEKQGSTVSMTATDSHRLYQVRREIPELKLPDNMKYSPPGIIIPRRGLAELKRLLDATGTCLVQVHLPYFHVRYRDTTLSIKLIDADFLPYHPILGLDHPKYLVVDRDTLTDSLRRIQLMRTEDRGAILQLEPGSLHLASTSPDKGDAQDEIEVETNETGTLQIGINPQYVLDFLQQMNGTKVRLLFNSKNDPCLLRDEEDPGYLGAISPMAV